MRVAEYLALGVGSAGCCLATPVVSPPQQFSAVQVKVTSTNQTAPVINLLKVYGKYDVQPPAQIEAAAATASAKAAVTTTAAKGTATGAVSAQDQPYDEQYLCQVTVGKDSMLLNFDTGSSDFWVYSVDMPTSQQGSHNLYHTIDSTSKKMVGYSYDISYGDNSGSSGKMFYDKVVVGAVTATSMAIGVATNVNSWTSVADGIVGLSFSNINTVTPNQQLTFFDTVISKLKSPVFTANLIKGAAGQYDFGYIDSTKYTGAITYVNVNSASGFWEIPITGYHIGTGSGTTYATTVIVDTGTSLMVLDSKIVNAYYAKVPSASYSSTHGGWIFPCSTTLPRFALTIGGTIFYVPGTYMNYGNVDNTNCYGGLQPNTGFSFGILGDVFMKAFFFVFNGSTKQLGIATKTLTS